MDLRGKREKQQKIVRERCRAGRQKQGDRNDVRDESFVNRMGMKEGEEEEEEEEKTCR